MQNGSFANTYLSNKQPFLILGDWGARIYVTYFTLSNFLAPLIALSFYYTKICGKIRRNLQAKKRMLPRFYSIETTNILANCLPKNQYIFSCQIRGLWYRGVSGFIEVGEQVLIKVVMRRGAAATFYPAKKWGGAPPPSLKPLWEVHAFKDWNLGSYQWQWLLK